MLAPTRELAEQIAAELRPLARARRHDVVSVYGGVGYGPQRKALDNGAELVVACPGRLEDLLTMRALSLQDVNQVVIDEADRMSDMGFLPAVRRILEQTANERQVLLFSATLDGAVGKLAAAVQRQPARHEVGAVGPDMTLTRHAFWSVDRIDRPDLTADVVRQLGSTMVFCRTRHGADRLARQLEKLGVKAAPIHGGRSQPQRDRALKAFQSGAVAALVATDVAARGVHVDDVQAVVHFDPPEDGSTYVHRSGRTARAGASGVVVSFVERGAEKDAKKLQRDIRVNAEIVRPNVRELKRSEPLVKAPRDRRRCPPRSRPRSGPRACRAASVAPDHVAQRRRDRAAPPDRAPWRSSTSGAATGSSPAATAPTCSCTRATPARRSPPASGRVRGARRARRASRPTTSSPSEAARFRPRR